MEISPQINHRMRLRPTLPAPSLRPEGDIKIPEPAKGRGGHKTMQDSISPDGPNSVRTGKAGSGMSAEVRGLDDK